MSSWIAKQARLAEYLFLKAGTCIETCFSLLFPYFPYIFSTVFSILMESVLNHINKTKFIEVIADVLKYSNKYVYGKEENIKN